MSRLDIKTASKAQTVVDRLYKDMERRIASSPPGLCPIDMSLTFLQLCHAQTCGKCVPCREGTKRMLEILTRNYNYRNKAVRLYEIGKVYFARPDGMADEPKLLCLGG